MKLVIDSGGVKRTLEGGFRMCGSKEDLIHLSNVLGDHIGRNTNVAYGWFDIPDSIEQSEPNTTPLSWTDSVET